MSEEKVGSREKKNEKKIELKSETKREKFQHTE
jgi:hypothetical protein